MSTYEILLQILAELKAIRERMDDPAKSGEAAFLADEIRALRLDMMAERRRSIG